LLAQKDTLMPLDARYAHTNLVARDWQSLARFYEELFGCVRVPPERDYAGSLVEAGTGIPGARLRGVHLRLPGYGDAGPTLEIFSYEPSQAPQPPVVNRPGYGHIAFATLSRPEVVVVPGGREGFAIREPTILAWLRAVHPHTRFTTSVCTGALVLGAAGLLRGVRATTHWYKLSQLKAYGARPTRRRVVQDGRIVTAAGVSAGIDMGLTLAQRLAGTTAAKVIQLGIEYDPHPPFQSGSPHRASWLTRGIAYLAMRRYNAVRPNTSQ
jgi:catechol 2,3-dioxygenase-like lactoylglutathione lyase family enzyme